MSGLLTRGSGQNGPGIPGACTTLNFTCLVRGPWSQVIIMPSMEPSYNNWGYHKMSFFKYKSYQNIKLFLKFCHYSDGNQFVHFSALRRNGFAIYDLPYEVLSRWNQKQPTDECACVIIFVTRASRHHYFSLFLRHRKWFTHIRIAPLSLGVIW